jgi:hypothetical protein
VDDAMMNATGAIATFYLWRLAQQSGRLDRWEWLAQLREPRSEPAAR